MKGGRTMHGSYYDMTIGRIPVGRPVELWNSDSGPEAVCGVEFGTILTDEQLKKHLQDDGDSNPYFLSVTDNGVGGEGTWLEISHDYTGKDGQPALHVYLSDASLRLLHAALEAVIRMRVQDGKDGGR